MNDKIAGKFCGTGVKAGLMYGMAEFSLRYALVIINTFFSLPYYALACLLQRLRYTNGRKRDAITDPMMKHHR